MNILIIDDDSTVMNMVEDEFLNAGHDTHHVPAPVTLDESYLGTLLSIVNGNQIKLIFSIGYYPRISLACGAMGISYISWITDISPDSYDYSATNKWNEIYIADKNLYNELIQRGLTNVYYLPLARTVDIGPLRADTKTCEPKKDVLVWTRLTNDTTNISAVMDELYDSTKGYIDAMVEQRKSDLYSWTLYENFPEYIKNDIERNYPMEENSLETTAHKYDWQYFFKKFEGTYSTYYLRHLLAPWNDYEIIDIAGAEEEELPIEDERISRVSAESVRENCYAKLDDYKAVVFLPDISNGNKLSEDMWNAMAHGAPILVPLWIDMEEIPDDVCYKFKNRRELDRLVRKFTKEADKRSEYTEKLRERALEEGTIGDRARFILDKSRIIKEITGGNS